MSIDTRDRVEPDGVDADLRAFLSGTLRFASLATVGRDGTPHVAVVWFALEPDGTILVNSAEGRRWPAELRADHRVGLSIVDQDDPYRWVGIEGVVESIVDDQVTAQADIARLARRYHADDPARAERLIAERFTHQRRVSFRIRPIAIHDERD